MWEKEEAKKIGVKEIKRCSIRVKVDFYKVCVYPILFNVLFIIL